MKKINIKIEPYLKRKKNLYSEYHIFADEASAYFGEPQKFAMYLGVAKRIGLDAAYRLFSEVRQSKVKTPAKLFMYKVKMHYLKINPRNFRKSVGIKTQKNAKTGKGRKK